jgi:hypothetical protein
MADKPKRRARTRTEAQIELIKESFDNSWLPPRDGGYKAVTPASSEPTAAKQKPVPPKGGSGVSRPTTTAKR